MPASGALTSPRPKKKRHNRLSTDLMPKSSSKPTKDSEDILFTSSRSSKRDSLRRLGDDTALLAAGDSSEELDAEALRNKLLYEAGREADYSEQKVPFQPGKSWTSILIACYQGRHRKVHAILQKTPEKVSQSSRIGWTGLHIAAACGHKKSASILLRKGADVNATDHKGRTPLHLACRYGQLDMYKYLVSKSADIALDNRGQHPIHLACKYGWTRLVAALLNNLASTNEVKSNGKTESSPSNGSLGELLSTADTHGRTPLLISLRSNKPDLVRLLVQHGASLDDVDERGCDVVHLAVESGATDVLSELVDKYQRSLDNRDSAGERPIHKVATQSKLQRNRGKQLDPAEIEPFTKGCLELLVQHGVDPNAKVKKTRQTALHLAAIRNIPRIVSILCQKAGADPSARDKKKKTPLHYAIDGCYDLIASMLVNAGADVCIRYTYGPELPLSTEFREKADAYNFVYTEPVLQKIAAQYAQEDAKHKKRDDLRVKKWQTMLGDEESSEWESKWLAKKHKKVAERVSKGIPQPMRAEAWRRLLAPALARLEENEGKYDELTEIENEATKQIDLDVQRTERNHVMFQVKYAAGQRALFHILKAYANLDPEIGYCQGMSGVAALMLMFFSEEEAFWMFVELMQGERFNMRRLFKPGFPGLYEAYYVHKALLAAALPELAQTFTKEGIEPEFYGTRWFMTIFLPDILPKPVLFRIWDMFLYHGYDWVFQVAIGLLRSHQQEYKNLKFEQIGTKLQKLDEEYVGGDEFMKICLKKPVKEAEIASLKLEYSKSTRQSQRDSRGRKD